MFSFDFTGIPGSNFMSISHESFDVVVALTLKNFSHSYNCIKNSFWTFRGECFQREIYLVLNIKDKSISIAKPLTVICVYPY